MTLPVLVGLTAVLGAVVGVLVTPLIDRESGARTHPVLAPAGTALLFGAVGWRLGLAWELPAYLFYAALSVPLAIIDVRTKRLPNRLTLLAYPGVAALLLLAVVPTGRWADLARAGLALLALLALYALLHLINPAGMGLGDVKLSGSLGAMLGWISWSAVLTGAVVGFVLGAVVGVALMLMGRASRKSALAFGPFMLAGAWYAILV